MKYKFYLKETGALSKITRFCDGRLLFSEEGMWENKPGTNQNLIVNIVSDEDWNHSDTVLNKKNLLVSKGWAVEELHKELYSKLVLSSVKFYAGTPKISDDSYSSGILKWICDNPTATEIPLDRHSDVNSNYLYMIRTKPTYTMSEEATKYVASCDPIDDDNKPMTGSKITIGEITDGFYKLCTLSDDQAKELQWAISIAMQVEGDGAKKSILEFMEENPIRDLVKTEDMQFLEMKKELSMAHEK